MLLMWNAFSPLEFCIPNVLFLNFLTKSVWHHLVIACFLFRFLTRENSLMTTNKKRMKLRWVACGLVSYWSLYLKIHVHMSTQQHFLGEGSIQTTWVTTIISLFPTRREIRKTGFILKQPLHQRVNCTAFSTMWSQ